MRALPPDIRKVYIKPIENRTGHQRVDQAVTLAIGDEMVKRQRFALTTSREGADAELSGAVGVVLPALTRIKPRLTQLAALGFVTIQVLAIGFHAKRGELSMALPLNLVLLSLSLFVWWGRSTKAPITARS